MAINSKKKLLFVNIDQFGYHIDYLQYCKYLKDDFEITYLCWDYERPKIEEPGINVCYISRTGNAINRNFRLIQSVLKQIKEQSFSCVFIHYFKGASIISLLRKSEQMLHLDIRTGNVSPNNLKRIIYNQLLHFESLFFKSQSIISSGLRQKLGIKKNAYILPLGANQLNIVKNCKNKIHLLYVGTLSNRHIEDTIEGLYFFLQTNPDADIHYTIIGKGWRNENKLLQEMVNSLGLQNYIDLKGYIPYYDLIQYYEIANVGVSYIPITPYYEYQPATKTYEYLLAGMPVLATETYENKQVINSENGVLIKDTSESFAKGIAELYKNSSGFDEHTIKKSVENYEWSRIVKTMKETILQ